ncbi:MAG: PIN domain-containing protein [gamma proteobacterium symbiont of Bathyaustriella thionipta]|nr:PIN domain-containing protein [gamma proteobacterium symbiont of Bathyaustriella thionipta]MCU7951088.1 PIN domain-containing protein [gamma proteobacterium symbiont of Bathyaustriella thionipta]MCU7952023.1 PIN domain-containing protein [gamma proteobacterium symbiont of Bathyaustriella thionipta]MCU7957588.1 PIN domain-containing protein [gamma proteobacterium symbiont of Bathyaustriella thionipta]MCU7966085.1 PIN domain-containing protein [gamma proteobacterium symbiont of Bathyaustriella
MEVLVDTSVWIDYFRSGDKSEKLDFLIDENLIVINDLVLTELLPLLIVKQEKKVINLLKMVKKHPIHPDWEEIRNYQVSCLKSGSNGIGIADLLIAQNSIQNNVPVYSIDKHFKFMNDAHIGIKLYT